jgi:hypothetical protein
VPGNTTFQCPAAIGDPSRVVFGGRWFQDRKTTIIEVAPDGRNLTIINEWGQPTSGYVAGRQELAISSLSITARFGYGERRIFWSNGTEWTR